MNPVPVGVSLLTKADYRPLDICQMYRPLREQARSHSPCVGRYIGGAVRLDAISCGTTGVALYLAREGFCQVNTVSVGVSLLTKADYRPPDHCRMYRPLREQARSHSPCVGRYIGGAFRLDAISCGTTGVALHLAHEGLCQVNAVPVGVSLLTKADYRPPDHCRMYRPLREQARSHSPCVGRYIGGAVRLDAISCGTTGVALHLARDGVITLTETLSDNAYA